MITKKRLIDLICSYAEGATDNVADGVLYNRLADAILLELQPNGAKPVVSGSLPGWAAELLTEVRFRLLVDIDTDGEPRSSMAELLEMWDKVNKALDIKTIGQ